MTYTVHSLVLPTLYKKHVIESAKLLNTNSIQSLFEAAGFNGCMGSSDAMHVSLLNLKSWATLSHKGFKLNLPARSYNLTVTHCKQILCSTTGHPSTWNDKTIVLFDPLISGVNDGNLYNECTFSLFERNRQGEIVEVQYKGVWFMVDNGYLKWSCTIPPVKDAETFQEIRFSEWLESMRKDVECTFGILKQRFAILRNGIRLGRIKYCDQIWLTCCAIHNILLKLDGYDTNWDVSEYTNILNNNNETNNSNVPFALRRLNCRITLQHQDSDTQMFEYVDSSKFD